MISKNSVYHIMIEKHKKEFLEEASKQGEEEIDTISNTIVFHKSVLGSDYWLNLHKIYQKKNSFYSLLTEKQKKELDEYPEEIHNKIVLNFDVEFYNKKSKSFNKVLDYGFLWSSSPEGHSYWEDICLNGSQNFITKEEENEIFKLVKFINSKGENYKQFLRKCL